METNGYTIKQVLEQFISFYLGNANITKQWLPDGLDVDSYTLGFYDCANHYKEMFRELTKFMDEMSNYCNTITTGNLSHRIANVQQGLLSKSENIKFVTQCNDDNTKGN